MNLGSPVKSDPWTLVLARGGELGRLIAEHDWAKTPLGPMTAWPGTLKTMLGVCLATPSPMMLVWGEDRTFFYNDAAKPLLGSKHPERALGLPVRQVYHEVWETIGPIYDEVIQTGRTVLLADMRFIIQALVPHHEVYLDVSYVALTDQATGQIAGVHHTILEKTSGIIGARRLRLLHAAAVRAAGAVSDLEAYRACLEAIAEDPLDVPAALVYVVKEGDEVATLVAAAGISPEDQAALERVPVISREGEAPTPPTPWPFALAARTRRPEVVTGLEAKLPRRAKVLDIEAPHTAVVVALTPESPPAGSAFLVALATPLQPLNEAYRSFFTLLGGTLASAATTAEDLARERLRAEALAALDEAKTEFFSNVSHEFRTPLTLMLGPVADLIATGSTNGEVTKTLELVHRNGLRLQQLVNALLDVARLEGGGVSGVFEPIDIAAATREVASMFQAAIEKAGLRFLVDVGEMIVAEVDRDMWEKIVINLLSNALKHTFEGEIEVRLRRVKGSVELAVRDTGVGIPEGELPRVFERFHRVRGARSRTHEGSGIGLSLVRELVRLHHGEITVTSALERGTLFTVQLPAANVPLTAAPRAPAAGPRAADPLLAELTRASRGETPAERRSGKARVLVVDDNADMRTYVAGLLERHWDVELANDGAEALRRIRSSPPDLVLSDVMMPGVDGVQLLRAIREEPCTAAVPVVLLSARAGEEASIEGLAAGANDYLIKPFSSRELVARVATQLALEGARVDQVGLREESKRIVELEQFAREEAEIASRAKDEFLATASHELRTPLNAILGWARLLRMGKLDAADSVRAVETIERNALAQVQLIEDILDGSRIITGKLHLEIRRLDMTALVVAALDAVRPAAEAKKIDLSVVTDPAAARVTGDPERLQQVVWNLVNNAIKFTPKGGRVEVRLERVGTSIELAVSDSGQGISPEFLPHVFERFRQADGSPTRRHGGLGLGLALVRHLVEAHGGTVRAESEGQGRGARFVVTLPVRAVFEEVPAPLRTPSPTLPAEDLSSRRLDGVRMLVVDDEADARDLVATVLRGSGAEVSTAPSVDRALELLSQSPPMIVVSDIGMPGADGYELIRRLRAQVGTGSAQIRAVALTAYAREEDRRRAKEAGFQAHVAKPVEPSELLRVVVSVLRPESP